MQQIVTAVVKPSAKAFAYAYLYIVLPKLIKTLASRDPEKWAAVRRLLKRGFHPSKFPTFAASFVGGTHLLEPLLAMVAPNKFTATLAAGVLSALINFPRYQRHVKRFLLVDLTLIMATRAFDTAFSYRINRLVPAPIGDGALFVVACALIMYSWFFEPQTLPPAYRNWITAAANMDTEIVDVLKAAPCSTGNPALIFWAPTASGMARIGRKATSWSTSRFRVRPCTHSSARTASCTRCGGSGAGLCLPSRCTLR